MAKLKMKTVTIVALKKDRKFLLEHLQDSSLVELDCSKEAEGFERPDLSSRQQAFERYRLNADRALKILDDVSPEKKGLLASFSGRREIDPDRIGEIAESAPDTMEICNDIIALNKQCADNAAEQVRIKTSISQLEPWAELDVPLTLKGTQRTAAIIGSVPTLMNEEQLSAALAKDGELAFDFEIISSSRIMTCFVLFVRKEQKERAQSLLRELGFSAPAYQGDGEPKAELEELREKAEALEKDSEEAKEKIAAFAEKRRELEDVRDYFAVRADKYGAISSLNHSKHTFVISGYIPEEDCDRLQAICSRVDPCIVEFGEADENAPVKLKNNAFAAPAQGIVTMYASPGPDDIDPSPVLAFFFYFFFGMMFSDAEIGRAHV